MKILKNNKEDVIYILNKIKYPIEFFLMLILAINSYRLITIKAYQGYWSKEIIFPIIINIILAFGIFFYNCIKDRKKIENMFLNFAIPIGICYIVFMLPTYTPDASSHLWKSYEVSKGILFTKIDDNGKSETEVPAVISKYRETVLTKYSVLNEVLESEEAQNYNDTVKVDSPSKGYCFILFVGYAIGIAIARLFGLNIFIALLLARLVNFIIILLLGYISIKKIPFGKILLAIYLMMPMMMQQSTSFSADSLMNIMIILFISYTLNLTFKKEKLERKEKIVFLLLSAFIGISKVTYIPLIGLGIVLAVRRKELSKKEKILLGVATIIVALGSMMVLNKLNSGYTNVSAEKYLEEAGVNTTQQIKGIINNPINYIKTLLNDFEVHGEYYLYGCVGQYLGWLSIVVPNLYVVSYIILLIASIFVEKNEETLNKKEKAWCIFLGVLMSILIVTGLYIEWTGVGERIVAGVQGRYFIPIMILILLCISKKDNYIKTKNPELIFPMISAIINLLYITKIIHFFI